MLRAFKKKSKLKHSDFQITNSRGVNVGKFSNSELSLNAILTGNPFTNRESMLVVKIKNEGKTPIKSGYVSASVGAGGAFIFPGEIFGTSTIQEVFRSLAPSQSITYKISVKTKEGVVRDSISIIVSPSKVESIEDKIEVILPLVNKAVVI
jgi:hypothetical protein